MSRAESSPGASPVVGRLAPSPTGLLHLGHARTFLVAWWHLRSRGGRVLLRIEDLDRDRSRQEFEDALFEDLAWLGLDWDGPVERQSEHPERFAEALARLVADGRVYPCVCTRKELESAVAAPHADDGTLAYPGTCRGLFADAADAERRTGRRPALRLACPTGAVTFEDLVSGARTLEPASEFGDFPVVRRDGTPTYQLAVVVDDAAGGVTEVHRGDDLLASTGCQIVLQEALGLPRPRWIHLPLVLDADGRRLAKRHDALSLRELRARGVDPRALVARIARSAGLDAPEPAPAAAFVAEFDLARVPRSPVVLAPDESFDSSR